MKTYKVSITDSAELDIKNIYNYISIELLEPEIAKKQIQRIEQAVLSLELMPLRTPIIDIESIKNLNLRKLLVDNYSIIYTVMEDSVYIISVLYSSVDIENKLKTEF